jgi:hypothetical protein
MKTYTSVNLFESTCFTKDFRETGIVAVSKFNTVDGNTLESISSPFCTALVWSELIFRNVKFPEHLLNLAIAFLRSCMKSDYTWTFFLGDDQGYPSDTDDTAVIAEFLFSVNALPQVDNVAEKILENRCDDDRFYVWIKPEQGCRRSEVKDIIVDANVSSFLSKWKPDQFTLPHNLIENCRNFPLISESRYYSDPIVRAWFINRMMRSQEIQRQVSFAEHTHNIVYHLGSESVTSSKAHLYLLEDMGLSRDLRILTKLDNGNFLGKCISTSPLDLKNSDGTILASLFNHGSKDYGYYCKDFELLIKNSGKSSSFQTSQHLMHLPTN